MAEVVLYHHAQGLTKGVEAFAAELRQAGHAVHVPDLYEGHTFDTLEEGIAYAMRTGFDTLMERGVTAAGGLADTLVYAGFSLGVMPAQRLAQTRARAKGALLFHSCFPVSEFGGAWPVGVPVQVHGMDADPFFAGEGDLDAARALVRRLLTAVIRPGCGQPAHAPGPRFPRRNRSRVRAWPTVTAGWWQAGLAAEPVRSGAGRPG